MIIIYYNNFFLKKTDWLQDFGLFPLVAFLHIAVFRSSNGVTRPPRKANKIMATKWVDLPSLLNLDCWPQILSVNRSSLRLGVKNPKKIYAIKRNRWSQVDWYGALQKLIYKKNLNIIPKIIQIFEDWPNRFKYFCHL